MAKTIKYKPVEPLNLGVGGDKLSDFGRKYNHEISHIYDIINQLIGVDLKNETVDIDTALNENSINLVQNKAIAKAINSLKAKEETDFNSVKSGKAEKTHTHKTADITNFPTSLPAKDVYEWAKQKNKPVYCWNEIQCKPAILCGFKANDKLLPIIDGIVQFDLAKIIDVAVPNSLSDLVNDMGFISETAIDNKLYLKADKSTTYTKNEINNLVTEVTEAKILAMFEE